MLQLFSLGLNVIGLVLKLKKIYLYPGKIRQLHIWIFEMSFVFLFTFFIVDSFITIRPLYSFHFQFVWDAFQSNTKHVMYKHEKITTIFWHK